MKIVASRMSRLCAEEFAPDNSGRSEHAEIGEVGKLDGDEGRVAVRRAEMEAVHGP